MISTLDTSEPPEQASGARWFLAARLLLDFVSRQEPAIVEPVFPRPGTQPIEHLENALATWAQLWETCARDTVQRSSVGPSHDVSPAVIGELADAARRAVVVARVVATPDIHDDVVSLLEDAELLLATWTDPADQNRVGARHEAIRAVIERCRRLEDRVGSQASGPDVRVQGSRYVS